MTKRTAWVLLAAAGWTFFIWITRIGNILGDDSRSTGFKVVHVVLALISVGFAVAITVIAVRGLRRPERADASGGSSPASERPRAGYPGPQ
jgi:hypothetical protein